MRICAYLISVDDDRDALSRGAELLKVLGNPVRLGVILALQEHGERCVHELADLLEVNQPLMSQHLRVLRSANLIAGERAGKEIRRPVYDFTTHRRTDESVLVKPEPVVVIEGILVLSERELRNLMDLRIYVDADADLRLMRRLQRDIVERERTVASVIEQYQETVRPMHLQFVEPSKRYADIIVPEGYNESAVGTVTSMIRDVLAG